MDRNCISCRDCDKVFIHLVVCLTTGPKPLPKRALHIVRSRAFSFKWEYPVLSLRSSNSFLHLLPVTSILPCFFPSITHCRRQFLCKIYIYIYMYVYTIYIVYIHYIYIYIHSFIHLAVCLTTAPKPLSKRALHIVRSRASSFKWEYPLLSLRSSSSFLRLLPCLPVTSIPPLVSFLQ